MAVDRVEKRLKRVTAALDAAAIRYAVVGGNAVAADRATQRKPATMILQSALVNMVAMAHSRLLPGFLAKNPFRTDRVVARLDCPLLICYGVRDSLIPVRHARRLHDLVPRARCVEYDCDHNDFPGADNEAAYWGEITTFLAQNAIVTATGGSP